MSTEPSARAGALLRADAIRPKCQQILERVERGDSPHWRVDPQGAERVCEMVASHIVSNYPDLQIPYHSRLRHLEAAGTERVDALLDPIERDAERGITSYDLIIVSVLLDAGAGATWRYTSRVDQSQWARSEGLAVASLEMFEAGLFSRQPERDPHRADAARLTQLTDDELAQAFDVHPDTNPMIGLSQRAELLRRLGHIVASRDDVFSEGRPGDLFTYFTARAREGQIDATDVLATILDVLGPIWPSRHALDGVALGDVWPHEALATDGDVASGLVPFHKLSQWLSYSLLEPLEGAGYEIVGLDKMTALAEYRNGGLLIDLGWLQWGDEAQAARPHTTNSELVVEWRALTIALLDQLHPMLCQRLGLSTDEFPLVKMLQGGTWSAGRVAAKKEREDGSPPIQIERDGTVF